MTYKALPKTAFELRQMFKVLFVLSFVVVSGCIGENADERFDVGYSDGYAVGFNTECKIRATLIEGDWNSENYSRGYSAGINDGAIACRNSK